MKYFIVSLTIFDGKRYYLLVMCFIPFFKILEWKWTSIILFFTYIILFLLFIY